MVGGILDTRRHGYHGMQGCSSTLRGQGGQSVHRCARCAGERFDFVVAFVCWHFDIVFDEPDLPFQSCFNECWVLARCDRCGAFSEPVSLARL